MFSATLVTFLAMIDASDVSTRSNQVHLEAQRVFAHDRKIKIVKKVNNEPQFFFAHSESIFVEVFSTAHQFS